MNKFFLFLSINLLCFTPCFADDALNIENSYLRNAIARQVISQSITLDVYAKCLPMIVGARAVEVIDKPMEGDSKWLIDNIEGLLSAYRKIQIAQGMNETVLDSRLKPYFNSLKSIGVIEYSRKFSDFCGKESGIVIGKIQRATSNK